MLGEAILLRKAVDRFFEQYSEKELDLDRLLAEDWTLLTNVSSFLLLILSTYILILNPDTRLRASLQASHILQRL
jgi:hypothetical protein